MTRATILFLCSLGALACSHEPAIQGEPTSPASAQESQDVQGSAEGILDAQAPSAFPGDVASIEEISSPPAEPSCLAGPRWGPDAPRPDTPPTLPTYRWEGEPLSDAAFTHSVASGDPLWDRVILWSRFEAPVGDDVVDIFWEMALEPTFEEPVAAGWTTTSSERDFTIKVDALGLSEATSYYYRFRALGHTSPVGRTRTAAQGCLERLKIAVASCAQYARGYFVPYREIASDADVDLVIHLGDYLYEYGGSGLRGMMPPWEIVTLADYRTRYAHYRSDPDLQEAHRQHPWVVTWDDHESANDAYATGAQNHNPGEGDWEVRKVTAARAYAEWMPIRDQEDPLKIWRSLRFGDLVDLVMLETRLWARSPPAGWSDPEAYLDPERTLLGADQASWVADELAQSTATWAFIGQQVMVGQLQADNFAFNPDQWDGYLASRDRLFDAIDAGGAKSSVVLTGDIHSSWAIELARDPHDPLAYDPDTGAGALAVEFVTPGVTSKVEFSNDLLEFVDWETFAPHVRYRDIEKTGYLLVDINHEATTAHWRHFASITDPEAQSTSGATFKVIAGTSHLLEVNAAPEPRPQAPPLAP